jgi:hypothetical protein
MVCRYKMSVSLACKERRAPGPRQGSWPLGRHPSPAPDPMAQTAKGALRRRSRKGASFAVSPFFGDLTGVNLGFFSSSVCSAGSPGWRPWAVGVLLVGGRAKDSGAGWVPRSCGRRGSGELRGVGVVWLMLPRWLPPCGRRSAFAWGNPCP